MKKALIAGCGIGGPVVAMALQRAGLEVELFEAHAENAEYVGSFLNAASNGLDALRTLDAHRQVLVDGFPTPRMLMFNGAGKPLGEVQNGVPLDDGTVSITIKRGLMHRALRDEAVRRGIRLHLGKRLVASDGGSAQFEDGSRAEGDLLIGADGLHSRVRRLIDPNAPMSRYTGQLSVGGVAPRTAFAPTPNAYQMIFGRRAFFGYSVRESGEVYWFANVAADEHERATPDEWKRRLLALFADDAGPACEMISATEHELAAYPIYDLPTVPVWSRGSMVLVGDAAHATSPASGQGAAMAIEDAVVLAKCLRDVPKVGEAFAAYESLRRARVEKVVKWSAMVGKSKVPGPVGRFFRDLMMPFALKHFASAESRRWLDTYHVEWDAP